MVLRETATVSILQARANPLLAYTLAHVPTIARLGPYRFFFYSGDRSEPRHVHIEREDMLAKFWLAGPSLA